MHYPSECLGVRNQRLETVGAFGPHLPLHQPRKSDIAWKYYTFDDFPLIHLPLRHLKQEDRQGNLRFPGEVLWKGFHPCHEPFGNSDWNRWTGTMVALSSGTITESKRTTATVHWRHASGDHPSVCDVGQQGHSMRRRSGAEDVAGIGQQEEENQDRRGWDPALWPHGLYVILSQQCF